MKGEGRRQKILETLRLETKPVSGTRLAELCGVSRQVIVQDMALLKAKHPEILSTARGYVRHHPPGGCSRVFWVRHTNDQIEDELNTFVDLGGNVQNVIVEHRVYGRITGELFLSCRRDVQAFITKLTEDDVRPLKELTGGTHGHLVFAREAGILDEIGRELEEKGYLVRVEP